MEETNQYLTFKLGDEVFGLAINKVREVLDFTTVTKVPQTQGYMRGVTNLRGSVVPVIDLNAKFAFQFRGLKPNGTKNHAKHSPTSQPTDLMAEVFPS